jgi:hypothetical protein
VRFFAGVVFAGIVRSLLRIVAVEMCGTAGKQQVPSTSSGQALRFAQDDKTKDAQDDSIRG